MHQVVLRYNYDLVKQKGFHSGSTNPRNSLFICITSNTTAELQNIILHLAKAMLYGVSLAIHQDLWLANPEQLFAIAFFEIEKRIDII